VCATGPSALNVNVNFYATLRQISGGKRVDLELPRGATLNNALQAIMNRYPGMDQVLLDDGGRVQPFIRVFHNGRDTIDIEKALALPLDPGDRLDIFPAIAGGRGSDPYGYLGRS
jgi:molybdopterin synthase sulfur carrier subunit